jgi:lysophospholipase L1-like esterase
VGLGGACQAEPELADWFAARDDWDLATLALSVNMIGAGFDGPGFRERVAYMVDRVAGSNPARPVACITIYPHFRDHGVTYTHAQHKATPAEFRTILREVVAESPHANVHLIEGPEILTGLAGQTTDLIHPGDDAMIMMGQRLAEQLRPLLP